MKFYNVLKEHAETNSDKSAVIDGDITLTYRQLLERVEAFARALTALPLNQQSKLGILCVNQKENLIALLGGLLSRVPVVPLNPLLTPEDLGFIVKDAGIDILLINGMFIKPETVSFTKLFPTVLVTAPFPQPELLAANVQPFDVFLQQAKNFERRHHRAEGISDVLLYTSGTTARPKGVMLEEDQFFVNTGAFMEHLLLDPNDRCIVALPMFHSFGNIMVLTILRLGGTQIFLPQFQPKTILNKIAEHRATLLPLVPTIYAFLAELVTREGYDVSSLRLCISGGASLPEALLHKVESVLGVTVLEGYGLTETSPVISVNKLTDGSIPGSVGPVLSNLKVKIVDDSGQTVAQGSVGEILVKGPTVMKSYWNRPEETKETFTNDGWFKTGDLGHIDTQNRLFISEGRKKDLIIRAGENISPLAIENVLMNFPGVLEAAAVGVPHPRSGEQVKVCVVCREGMHITESELKEFCRENLPAFMKPEFIQFYDDFPKTATGKILKSQLREN